MSIIDNLNPFKLQKLRICSYEKAAREIGTGEEVEVMFNPESVQKRFNNGYYNVPVTPIGQGTVDYSHSAPSSVSMKLIFDDTQVNEYAHVIAINKFNSNYRTVSDRIDEFLKLIVKRKGATHETPHLTISWGKTLNYQCRLQSLDINYTLFDRSGSPLRAELSVSFIEDDLPVAQVVKAELESPDLTHYRMVKEGDQLPLMCEAIYGSPNYYMEVARVNKIKDFRNLKLGQEIYFPPIVK
ncbi:hypothetical protein FIA58_000140 [Flavobacterium jejuense]|uniref:Contractile injection system tube protein N-terminal domain-containing protein n=1 Tax=Flavobacterium jejuense TaxID=1544455 RepID=A0ABX0IPL6_9FLAO|nr:hypothetical protein [Flavobacterium jejuense]NHN24071.1 hypothetical protein [Flavobacterium jejuense]